MGGRILGSGYKWLQLALEYKCLLGRRATPCFLNTETYAILIVHFECIGGDVKQVFPPLLLRVNLENPSTIVTSHI